MQTDKTIVCLLAAGRGRRAGGPKAWRIHEGGTLLERQIKFLLTIFYPQNIFVSIQKDWVDRCLGIARDIRWVVVDPDQSVLASLAALLCLNQQGGWAYVYHVDMPLWQADFFKILSSDFKLDIEAIVPTYQGSRGHPVALSPGAQQDLMRLDPVKDRLDFWLRSRLVNTVEVPDARILENWNL